MKEIKNTSGIHPKANKLLVLDKGIESMTKSGLIIPIGAVEKEQMANMFGTVIVIGRMCWVDEVEPRCAIGDEIIFGKYSGETFLGNDGIKYRLINARDVIATKDPIEDKQDVFTKVA